VWDCPSEYAWRLVEAYIRRRKPSWIIFRATPSTFYHDTKVAEIAKKYGAKTLMLCWNLHHIPERVKQECPELDVYCNLYHYEYAIEPLMSGYDVYWSRTTDLPPPAWDLVPSFKPFFTRTRLFNNWSVVRGSRGCPYGCFFCHPEDTIITTIKGNKPIQDIPIGETVKSLQGRSRVIKNFARETDKIITIITEDGRELQLTPEHPVFTKRGWVFAKDLKRDDKILVE